MKRIIAAISVLAVVFIATLYLSGSNQAEGPGYGAARAEQQQATTENAGTDGNAQAARSGDAEDPANKDMILGDPDAPVTVIEYASFTCPHCARAHCGGDMRYFGLAKMIFEDGNEWIAGGDGEKAIANLRKIGRAAGLSDEDMNACFSDEQLAKDLVAWYQKTATEDEITGTPSFVINGKKYSNMSYEDFAKAIEEALAAAGN